MTSRYSPVEVSLDKKADAAYVTLSDAPIARTVEVTDRVFVDLDEMAVIVGVEILGLDTEIPFDRLADFHARSEVIDLLRLIKPSVGAFVFTSASAPDSRAVASVGPAASAPGPSLV